MILLPSYLIFWSPTVWSKHAEWIPHTSQHCSPDNDTSIDRWNILDLLHIHLTSAKLIIHISESSASTYWIMYNSLNIPSCPRSLPLNTWHYFCHEQLSSCLSIYRTWLFVSVGNLNTSTKPSMMTSLSFCYCTLHALALTFEHSKDSL